MFSYTPYGRRLAARARVMPLLFCLAASIPAVAQNHATPDNSGTNKSQNQGPTADQQKNNKSDRQLTAEIRRSVVKDSTLSSYAHNVKIVVLNGAVTLKGPVHSEEEKQNIAAKAAAIVGQDKVTNQITVKQ